MSHAFLGLGRLGIIFLCIVNAIIIPFNLLLTLTPTTLVIGLGLGAVQLIAIVFASFIFLYFSKMSNRLVTKLTFALTLIAVPGLFVNFHVMIFGIFIPHLIFIEWGILIVTLPAIIVFMPLWGVSFREVSVDTGNPSWMMTGGNLVLIGWIVSLVGPLFDLLQIVAQIILILGLIYVVRTSISRDV